MAHIARHQPAYLNNPWVRQGPALWQGFPQNPYSPEGDSSGKTPPAAIIVY